jgi:CIC family chloride channel protein
MEFEAAALLYTMLGSLVAYVINGVFVGWQPLFQVPPGLSVPEFTDYIWYAVLGVGSGIVATLLPMVFYGMRDFFHKIPLPPHIKPAIGGLCVGLLALVLPQVLGGGYGWIQEAINGRLSLMILLALIFAKMLAFALTVSSGGSGGVFAPSLFVGGMAGGFMAELFHQPPAAFVIVGMAAVFGGAARVPIATLLMVTEMTGGYQLLVPAALAVMLSYLVQTILSSPLKYRSLYEAQMPSRAESPAHDMENFCIALDLVCKPWVCEPNRVCHLDLMTLLKSGVAVNLSEEKQLTIGILRLESSWVGKPARFGSSAELGGEFELIAILREGQIRLPHPDTLLQAGDRLLVITSSHGKKHLERYHLAPLPSQ